MGTHPIFESDFDCLTERIKMESNSSTNQKKRRPRRLRRALRVPTEDDENLRRRGILQNLLDLLGITLSNEEENSFASATLAEANVILHKCVQKHINQNLEK